MDGHTAVHPLLDVSASSSCLPFSLINPIFRCGRLARADPSPTRSGPEGSSRNDFRFGSLSSLPPDFSSFGYWFPWVNDRVMNPAATSYRVLARKYRPTDFSGLIGQEALVRTLTNAIHSGRLAHAFVLTGVRGVGKTTTARIIARALNCVGPDGQGGPTAEPCGVCEHCRAIAEDRHVDVIEMDARVTDWRQRYS